MKYIFLNEISFVVYFHLITVQAHVSNNFVVYFSLIYQNEIQNFIVGKISRI
jgi:hypothetical protein